MELLSKAPAPDLIHTDEAQRLAALHETRLMDSEPEEDFDELAQLAAQICGTPMSVISLVDRDRQWFKARVGMQLSETSRELSFCNHALRSPELFQIEDATRDLRFQNNPLVTGDPGIRFYAGMPLAGPRGHLIGTLCVLDTTPRHLTPGQQNALLILARQAQARMEQRIQKLSLQKALQTEERLVRELSATRDRFRMFMDNAPFISFMRDTDGRFLYYNRTFAQRFGIESEDWIGKTTHDLFHPEAADVFRRNDLEAIQTGSVVERLEPTIEADGSVTHWRSYKFPWQNERGETLVGGISIDASLEIFQREELQAAYREVERLASVDPLTGLANRRILSERAELAFKCARRQSTPLSILMLDIDDFKKRNDRFGHAAGDDILQRIGKILTRLARATDVTARYGGEELVVVLPATDSFGAQIFAGRLCEALAREPWPDAPVTLSIGIASLDQSMPDAAHLIGAADNAMYAAKRAGKNRVAIHPNLA